jgi:hypothetical protein
MVLSHLPVLVMDAPGAAPADEPRDERGRREVELRQLELCLEPLLDALDDRAVEPIERKGLGWKNNWSIS